MYNFLIPMLHKFLTKSAIHFRRENADSIDRRWQCWYSSIRLLRSCSVFNANAVKNNQIPVAVLIKVIKFRWTTAFSFEMNYDWMIKLNRWSESPHFLNFFNFIFLNKLEIKSPLASCRGSRYFNMGANNWSAFFKSL